MKKGFTLVELSIVLVIIGLLTGGILVAQSLIDSAKIGRVISEMEQYTASVRLFHSQFKGLPGDSSRAARIIGVGDPNVANDNGAISWGGVEEGYWAWRQLSLTGHIPKDADTVDGLYSGAGIPDPGGPRVEPGVNAPLSKVFDDAVWFLDGAPGFAWNLNYTPLSPDPHFVKSHIRLAQNIDGPGAAQYPSPWNGPLNVEQVLSIDAKIDDGRPGLGEVMAHARHVTHIYGCATTTVAATAEYDLSQEGNVCHVVFWLPDF